MEWGTLSSDKVILTNNLVKRNADPPKTNLIVKTYSNTDSANMSWDLIIKPIRFIDGLANKSLYSICKMEVESIKDEYITSKISDGS